MNKQGKTVMAEAKKEEADEEIKEGEEGAEGAEGVEGAEGAEGEPKPKSKKLLFIIIGVVVLLIGGGAGAYFMGLFGGHEKKPSAEEIAKKEEEAVKAITYYNFPEILVNLNEPGRKGKFLKLTVVLELTSPEHTPVIEKLEPRIIDQFQMYLRELRFDDLQGSEGVHRLREELLRRINDETKPMKIKDILFKNILVQ